MLRNRPGAFRVLHPFPSALNALLVLGLALIAGARPASAFGLALAMLGIQFAIGAANDVFDEDLDARSKPDKPIPAGLVTRRTAGVVVLFAGGGGLVLSALHGVPVLLMAMVMLGAGLAYDIGLKRGPWGWVAFSVAFPVLPVFAWYGAVMELPPRWEALLPVAMLAGPALQLSNGVVDLERDRGVGVVGLAGRLGRGRAVALMSLVVVVIHAFAWVTLVATGKVPVLTVAILVAASALAVTGLLMSAAADVGWRERGWRAQAAALALLAVGWLAAVSVVG